MYGIRTKWRTLPFIYFIDIQVFITFTYYKSEIICLIYSKLSINLWCFTLIKENS